MQRRSGSQKDSITRGAGGRKCREDKGEERQTKKGTQSDEERREKEGGILKKAEPTEKERETDRVEQEKTEGWM